MTFILYGQFAVFQICNIKTNVIFLFKITNEVKNAYNGIIIIENIFRQTVLAVIFIFSYFVIAEIINPAKIIVRKVNNKIVTVLCAFAITV